MFQQLPMFQQVGQKAYRNDLSNIKKLINHLQNPQEKFKTIHVAGTNGKGSVSHMLASVLQESGYKVGLYTSPHLKDFRERIKINGEEIEEQAVTDFIAANAAFFNEGNFSFFEMTVGLAFNYFSEKKVDIAVIETGLGGRLDSTNIILPELSVITNIGYDHTHILGNTLAAIAREKAGIIKPRVPVVIGEVHQETLPEFQKCARELEAPVYLAEGIQTEDFDSDLKGAYQRKNIKTALAALQVLQDWGWKIVPEAGKQGLQNTVKNTGLRGRWEILREQPKVICDTAHNKEGLSYIIRQLKEEEQEHLLMVFGVVNDKDLSAILPLLPKKASYFYCKPNVSRGMDTEVLREEASRHGLKGTAFSSVSEAYKAALESAGIKDLIFVGGSTFTVAEII